MTQNISTDLVVGQRRHQRQDRTEFMEFLNWKNIGTYKIGKKIGASFFVKKEKKKKMKILKFLKLSSDRLVFISLTNARAYLFLLFLCIIMCYNGLSLLLCQGTLPSALFTRRALYPALSRSLHSLGRLGVGALALLLLALFFPLHRVVHNATRVTLRMCVLVLNLCIEKN